MTAATSPALHRVLAPLVDPATFDFWVQKINPLWSWDRVLARVVELRREAEDAVSLVLQPNRHFRGFQPGQHLNVSAELQGRRTTRSYSFTRPPAADGQLHITVKHLECGKLSSHLCTQARVGDVLELSQAFGSMTLPNPAANDLCFLAAGSGITPLMALTRAWAQAGASSALSLLYWARTRAQMCFAEELQKLAQQWPQLQLQLFTTHEREGIPCEEHGLLSSELLQQHVPDLHQRRVLACGPGGFVQTARALCDKARSFMGEGFTAPALAPDTAGPATVEVTLTQSQRTVTVPTGMSLLEALESAGLNPAHGCRMGVCHTCTCTRTEGITQSLQTGALETETGMDVRLCVSRARTPLTLDL
ncbi:ferredoxin reductase [Curvibacter sp. APW13]|uniref:ferredoxin reductase n=1 Tax=Curvibacter sp. APW13 TaxID=3077236 RepID=UPI0028DD4FE1|nr:ferredoxin reductase [Curvibacter sp. APW13]MDT8989357.1 ferredoxin reductase [Curvibacter sp. APW13]